MNAHSKAHHRILMGGMIVAALTACSTTPTEPVGETLDSETGTTVTLLPKPVELLTENVRSNGADPFAYVAPFETNRMGERMLFLWVSAPQNAGALALPRLACDGAPVSLAVHSGGLAELGLSRAPYAPPAPWSAEWYFRLPDTALQCLAGAQQITVETQAAEGEPERYSAGVKALASLDSFVNRLGR